MTILVYNIKGGSGKTTVADELMFSAERENIRAAYIDLDDQQSSIHVDQTAGADNADFVVVDTPGARSQDAKAWMEGADIIVIPTNASGRDIPMLMEALESARTYAPHTARVIVVNRFNRYKAATEFMTILKEAADAGEIICTLPQSETFQTAYLNDMSVVELALKSTAAYRTLKMVNAIRHAAGLGPDPVNPAPIKIYLDMVAERERTRRKTRREN